MKLFTSTRLLALLVSLLLAAGSAFGAPAKKKNAKSKKPAVTRVVKKSVSASKSRKGKTARVRSANKSKKRISSKTRRARSVRGKRARGRSYVAGGPWRTPSFADSTEGDNVNGEDLVVRRAAVQALGGLNGSVVVVDPETGRVLTIVNQKLAFSEGYQPCSTVKIYAALAGLSEGLIEANQEVRLYGRVHMDLTEALAKSNNPYFAMIGTKLGYNKIAHYSKLFGLGEKAGWNIAEESAGHFEAGPPKFGGMGMMTSFGEGIKLTPLQLASTLSAVANGGTLYYLQYPRTEQELQYFVPRIKRKLAIAEHVPALVPGLKGATEWGTARRAFYDSSEPIFGKTGTCTDRTSPTHLGWFGSYNEVGDRKLVVVVLLTGGGAVNGPVASGVAGQIYRMLSEQKFHQAGITTTTVSPVALISGRPW
jgi:beta-lactamase class D